MVVVVIKFYNEQYGCSENLEENSLDFQKNINISQIEDIHQLIQSTICVRGYLFWVLEEKSTRNDKQFREGVVVEEIAPKRRITITVWNTAMKV